MKLIRNFAILIVMLIVAGFSQRPPKPFPPAPPVEAHLLSDLEVPQDSRLGISFAPNKVNEYPALADLGMTKGRITLLWSKSEPRFMEYVWTGLDSKVRAMQSEGIEPFITFATDAPQWTWDSNCFGKQPNRAPRDLIQLGDWVQAAVERYDGDGLDDMPGLTAPIRFWQGPNEWTNGGCDHGGWAGTPNQFVALTNAEYDAAHLASPDVMFVLGGVASGALDGLAKVSKGDQKFGRFMNVIDQCLFDMIDGHFYGPESLIPAKVAFLRQFGKPICRTEAGGPSLKFEQYTPQAHFLAVLGINLACAAEGVDFALWFRTRDGGQPTEGNSATALMTKDGTPKPGLYAYRLVAYLLDGAVMVAGHNPYLIAYADGTKRTVAWGGAATVHSNGPAIRIVDVEDGSYEILPAGDYPIGALPVVTEWAGE